VSRRAKITHRFCISSSRHLRAFLNRKIQIPRLRSGQAPNSYASGFTQSITRESDANLSAKPTTYFCTTPKRFIRLMSRWPENQRDHGAISRCVPIKKLGVCRRIPSSARERAVFRLARTAKQAISVYIVDAAGRSPVGQQAARSQIGFSDRLLGTHSCGMSLRQ